MDKIDVEGDADMVEGTLSIFGKLTKVLVDPGSTHSFAKPRFLKGLGLKFEVLPYLVEVSTPTGSQTLETDKMCKSSEVRIGERNLPVNQIALPINGHDVILDMD